MSDEANAPVSADPLRRPSTLIPASSINVTQGVVSVSSCPCNSAVVVFLLTVTSGSSKGLMPSNDPATAVANSHLKNSPTNDSVLVRLW